MSSAKLYIISKTKLAIITIIMLSFLTSIYFYSKLPERIAIHWNMKGDVDSYAPKIFGVFAIPLILSISTFVLLIIPKIDPLRENIEKFRRYYDIFIIIFLLFMFLIHAWIIFWNIGWNIIITNPNIFFSICFSFLFFYLSILLEKAKRNWFIGIRTPWTMSSDRVWKNTHKLGGRLFKIVAILSIIGIFFEKYSLLFILIPTSIISFYLILYSYLEYEKENRKRKL